MHQQISIGSLNKAALFYSKNVHQTVSFFFAGLHVIVFVQDNFQLHKITKILDSINVNSRVGDQIQLARFSHHSCFAIRSIKHIQQAVGFPGF